MKKRYIILAIIIILLLVILSFGIYYINDYYHADDNVNKYLKGTKDVKVINTTNGLLLDGNGNDTALIFYPGAKVEYTSYIPMLMELSESGIDCYLVEMPFNLAFFGQDSADEIIDSGNYSHYFIAGHSLGGVVASSYVNQTNKSDGLILFASYPTEKIEKPVLSIYGSEDKVFNIDSYNEAKPLMSNLTEIVIKGGNHGQVGNYGNQSDDGQASITWQKQQDESVKEIIDFINKISFT